MQVGNGLIDAIKVVNYATSLSFSSSKIALNDTRHFSRYHPIEITNGGDKPVTYSFQIQDAAGYTIWQPRDHDVYGSPYFKMAQDVDPMKIVPKVSLPGGTFTVQPGETRRAQFDFDYPAGFSNVPVYSGKIMIVGSNGETVSVPYYGIASYLKEEIGSQNVGDFPHIWSGPEWPYPTLDEHSNFTFDLSVAMQDFPRVYANWQWGVRQVRWDILEAGWTERRWGAQYPPVLGQDGYLASVAFFADSGGSNYHFDPDTMDANYTVAFPIDFMYRSAPTIYAPEFWWLGKLANGSQIAPGKYT